MKVGDFIKQRTEQKDFAVDVVLHSLTAMQDIIKQVLAVVLVFCKNIMSEISSLGKEKEIEMLIFHQLSRHSSLF